MSFYFSLAKILNPEMEIESIQDREERKYLYSMLRAFREDNDISLKFEFNCKNENMKVYLNDAETLKIFKSMFPERIPNKSSFCKIKNTFNRKLEKLERLFRSEFCEVQNQGFLI